MEGELSSVATVEVHLRRRYQCSLCHRAWSSMRQAMAHVQSCVKDPGARACPTCQHDVFEGGQTECLISHRPCGTVCVRNCEKWELRVRTWFEVNINSN